jgi:predicted nucleic acid-binding protein
MILLDTNIVSELMRTEPATQVIEWLNDQNSSELYLSAITVAEISYGLNALPAGARRKQLKSAFNKALDLGFKHRILAFDFAAAEHYGIIMADRKAAGRPLSVPDGQIAAITYSQGLLLATRNGRDFVDCGIEIVNPFKA